VPPTTFHFRLSSQGGDRAKIKDEPWSGKTIQKDRDRKGEGEEGVRTAYPDEEIGQSETKSQKTQDDQQDEC
jgi:hypothetical protein